jgi:hypothetical protein
MQIDGDELHWDSPLHIPLSLNSSLLLSLSGDSCWGQQVVLSGENESYLRSQLRINEQYPYDRTNANKCDKKIAILPNAIILRSGRNG